MATDLAYNALRIGPNNNLNRALSFATTSDPGFFEPNTTSFYYNNEDGDLDIIGSMATSANVDDQGDISSLVRSDVAVYGGAGDDVKFPFLPDNFSEFNASIVYSPITRISTDG
ncbi:hypothetical protein GGI12_005535, partial [Dipsacomyces acuminosporus]